MSTTAYMTEWNALPDAEKSRRMLAHIAQAKREGRHSDAFQTVCMGCGNWVGSIMHVTLDKKRLGACCAPKPIDKVTR